MSKIKHKHHGHEESGGHDKMEEKLKSLTCKVDQLLSNFENMEKRIDKIESRLNENEQKQISDGDDGFKEKILKEMEAMKKQINSLTLNDKDIDSESKLKLWLTDNVKCPQYFDTFIQNGIKDLSAVSKLNMERLKAMGIDEIADQMQLLNGILKLNQAQ